LKVNSRYTSLIVFLFILLIGSSNAFAQKKKGLFKDTLDGAFDISEYMYNLHGFLPIPTVITEPAVGYGGALAAVFFIPHKNKDSTRFQLPDFAGAAGGYTQNGTWFVGAGYVGFWKQDRIRYRGVFGYGDVNLKYYGSGDGFLSENPIKFNLSSYFFLQQIAFRIGNSGFLLGGRYKLSHTTVSAFQESEIIKPKDFKLTNSGVGFISEYEKLDNILSPTKGWRLNLSYDQFLKVLGSDRDFGNLSFFTLYYLQINKIWTSGFRVESLVATGDPPFYSLPFIALRGVPVMRYQGEITALIETEQQVVFTRRWGMVAFGGYGQTFNYSHDLLKGSKAWSAGAGVRYLIARRLGLKMGIDVARGPEDWAIYVVFGSAWLR